MAQKKLTCAIISAVECRYNAVQHNMIFRSSLQGLRQNVKQRWNRRKTPINRPGGRAIGCLSWMFCRILTALLHHFICRQQDWSRENVFCIFSHWLGSFSRDYILKRGIGHTPWPLWSISWPTVILNCRSCKQGHKKSWAEFQVVNLRLGLITACPTAPAADSKNTKYILHLL